MTANSAKKSLRKKIIMALCTLVGVVAISVTSVLATVAYLTSSAAVSNVFTIGNVGITMTESKVNPDGTLYDGGATRVDTNTYHLVPNTKYIKDPTITVNAGSENSYLFTLVRNDIAAIECQSTATDFQHNHKGTIAEQLAENGWAKYTYASTGWVYVYVGVGNVPEGDAARAHVAGSPYTYGGAGAAVTAGNYKLFDEFTVDPNAKVDNYGAAKITLTGVAIQKSGFDNLAQAWSAVVATYPYIHTGSAN